MSRSIRGAGTLLVCGIALYVAHRSGSPSTPRPPDAHADPFAAGPHAALLAAPPAARVDLDGPDAPLSRAFPEQAARIVAGDAFVASERGFAVGARGRSGRPTEAAERALTARGGLRLELPADGAGEVTFSMPGGFALSVRERGARGPGRIVRGAVAYARAGGTAYWSATPAGFEEWVLVEDASEAPVAQWEIRGGTLRAAGEQVEVLDASGTPRLRVVAPEAFSEGGARARAWLTVDGDVLSLHTDARGRALVDPVWSSVGSLNIARRHHTATLLPSGKVLVAGGNDTVTSLASAELYDPATGRWSWAGQMLAPRSGHAAVLLRNGKVLVTGGIGGASTTLATAEVYDPLTGKWSATGAMAASRAFHTANVLRSGKVAVAGGQRYTLPNVLASVELYDPVTGSWTSTGAMATARSGHSATLLPSGQLLVAGGFTTLSGAPTANAERYDEQTGRWIQAASLNDARGKHSATLLASGRVLVAGGVAGTAGSVGGITYVGTTESYDPAGDTWRVVADTIPSRRADHSATLLPSGMVLRAGGMTGSGYDDEVSAFDPALGAWLWLGQLATARADHTATLLLSGKILFAGGSSSTPTALTTVIATSEEYDPAESSWSGSHLPRHHHTATPLPNGKVLVVGGASGNEALSSVELYDVAQGTWSPAPPLAAKRAHHTATLLASGQVLVAGGCDRGGPSLLSCNSPLLTSAELYDPVTNRWSGAGTLAAGRADHTATLLSDGRVLAVGGGGTASSCEVYDPASDTWTLAAPLAQNRDGHTATRLPDGRVLVAGGSGASAGLTSAEIYDPATARWTAAGSLREGRTWHTATLLASGKVLVAAGYSAASAQRSSAELYDPATNAWTPAASLAAGRYHHAAAALPDGRVLVTGGFTNAFPPGALASTELYDPAANAWTPGASLATERAYATATALASGNVLVARGRADGDLGSAELYEPANDAWRGDAAGRDHHTATLLPNGKVLVAGGAAGGSALASAQLVDGATLTVTPVPSLVRARSFHTATLLPSGKVLVAGGCNAGGVERCDKLGLSSTELFDPALHEWTAGGSLASARSSHSATLLPSGKVLVAGGWDGAGVLASAEVYDPATSRWTGAGAMATARQRHTATLLRDGRVLVAGGQTGDRSGLASAELYDPVTNAWSSAGSLGAARIGHSATLLPGGKILVAGGYGSDGSWPSSTELYDPATNAWTPAAPFPGLDGGRQSHAATLLASGKVLVTGGTGLFGELTTAQVYDPAANVWSPAGSLGTGRTRHSSTLLPDGRVLIAHGAAAGAPLPSVEVYDDGRAPLPPRVPRLDGPLSSTAAGARLDVAGALLTGDSEGVGGTHGSPANFPVFALQRQDSDEVAFAKVLAFDATSASLVLPPSVNPGPHWMRAVVNGIPSTARPLVVTAPVRAIAALTPASGPAAGGTSVDILGAMFQPGATVTFGATFATGVEVIDSGTVRAVTPPGLSVSTVGVHNPDASVAWGPAGYSYIAGPVITCPGDVFAEATSATWTVVTYPPATSTEPVTYSTSSGSPFQYGRTTIQAIATDVWGQTDRCYFDVRVVDTTPPTVTCPAPVTVEAAGADGARVTYPPATATDLVTATPAIGYSAASGSLFPVGTTAVLVTAADGAGNERSCTFAVTVVPKPPPVIYAVAPSSAPIGHPADVTILGTGFQPGAHVSVGTLTATVTFADSTTLFAHVPESPWAGPADVVVQNPDLQLASLHDGFTFTEPTGVTAAGVGVVVAPQVTGAPTGDATPALLTFDTVTQGGETTATVVPALDTAPPAGFRVGDPPVQYEIATTASYAGPIEVCLEYPAASLSDAAAAKLLHYEGGRWVDITTSNDVNAHVVCGRTSSLSPFVVAERIGYAVLVSVVGDGGSVTSADTTPALGAGSCTSASCAPVAGSSGKYVTLTATATDALHVFKRWEGCSSTSGDTCSVWMYLDRQVVARFEPATYPLTLAYGGVAQGTVAGITWDRCDATGCTATIANGATVTLSAQPGAGAVFRGWGVACTGTGSCAITMNGPKTLTATFDAASYPMTVSVTGAGRGAVASAPAGIDCGDGATGCSAAFVAGTSVTLTERHDPAAYVFLGWSGGACKGTSATCTVGMNASKTVSARFEPVTYPVAVTVAGGGTGTVSSTTAIGPNLACTTGSTAGCTAAFAYGAAVALTAAPGPDAVFVGWSGCSAVSGSTCTVYMTAARSVVATFQPATFPLTVALGGTGTGTVAGTATPSGGAAAPIAFTCGTGSCAATVAYGATVSLTATPSPGSSFKGWGVVCTGAGTCSTRMTAPRNPTATFSSP